MASILLEPVVPNLTKISSGDHLRDLWRLFTKVKDCTQGGRRLENLYWRLWYQSTTTGNVKGQNICNLLETWKEDGDCLNVSKFREASSLSRSESADTSITSTPAPAIVDAPAPLVSSNVAAPAPAPAVTTSASTTLVPLVTPSIQISRVSSTLKVMAANANNVPAIPVAPAVPRSILPKKCSVGSSKSNLTPSRVSVGFSAAAAATTATGLAEKPLQFRKVADSSSMSAAVQSKFVSQTPITKTTPAMIKTTEPCTPAPPAVSKMKTPEAPAKNVSKKKFFVEDSDSFDSMEGGLEESYRTQQLHFEPVQEPTQQPVGTFSKIEPEPEFKPSNLSNLLRAPPRRVPNKFNPFAPSNQNYRSKSEDMNQTLESESIRRCLQLDRKPLFDPNIGFSSSSTSSFPASLPVW